MGQVKGHPFFVETIAWDELAEGRLAPPWEPTVVGSLDTSQFDNEFTSMPINSPTDGKVITPPLLQLSPFIDSYE